MDVGCTPKIINDINNKPISNMREDGSPLGSTHYGGKWDIVNFFKSPNVFIIKPMNLMKNSIYHFNRIISFLI